MLRRIITTISILVLATLLTTQAAAQSYFFSLDKEVVNVYWNSDGTLALDYLLTFTTQLGGHTIDFVDVGMPNGNFDLNTARADIDGHSLAVSSDFQGSGGDGFSVGMGQYAIQPGQTGTVHVFVGSVSRVLYKDSSDGNYASAVFSPLYFQSNVVTGNTDIIVIYHLPPNVQPNEPRWHSAPSGFPSQPQTGFDSQGRITYTWHNPNANGWTQYKFGASFPKKYVPSSSIVTVSLPSISVGTIFNVIFICFFGFIFFGIPIVTAIGNRRRKLQYLPPRISIEGHGIKRGLTAVEAAILLGEPLDKVMTMILFGTIKKNAAQVTSRDPLQIEVASPMPQDLHDYEVNFLNAFKESNAQTRRNLLEEVTVKLVRRISEKMKGFSRRETIDYYRNIMETAWKQVEEANTPEVKSQLFEKNLEWTMLDRDYNDRTRRVFTGPVFVPTWWGRYDPIYGRTVSGSRGTSSPSPSSSSSTPSVPRLPGADFASSVAVGMQTFSQKVIGNVNDFTTRVTNVTNPLPKPTTSGGTYGGHTGGGGGCACACAGCACACAGGGR
jgi:hypothetical protein